MNLTIFEVILILLTVSIFTSIIFKKLNIPVIVGYIAVGMMVGPYSGGIVVDNDHVRHLAEFGMVFLLFSIGLEFSFAKIIKMKRAVFGYGGLEVTLATLVTVAIGVNLWLDLPQAIILGGIVAMSSTAIVTKQLADQLELNLPQGINSIGILLFQDLAVIPFLILIPSLANFATGAGDAHLATEIGGALLKALGAMLFIYIVGRKVLRPVFYGIARMHSLELFSLTTLFVTLISAWLTYKLGLSMTLGAFMAGMMLGDTEFRHQIESDIRPFRDVLMGFFFITIGMQFNAQIVVEAWQWILLLFFALLFFKVLLIWAIGSMLRVGNLPALRSGLILAHGGEFGVAILHLAMVYQLLPTDYAQVTLAALLMSMLVAPIIIRYNCNIARFILPKAKSPTQDEVGAQIEEVATNLQGHVIIGGYGRVGQNIARFLEQANIPFLAFDLDPVRVKQAQKAGDSVFYADITHHDIFVKANLKNAKALVLSFYNTNASIKILEQVRIHDKDLTIIARAHDEQEASMLYDKGATEVIPEVLEASLMLASHILLFMNVNPTQVSQMIKSSRHNRYDLLRMVFPGEDYVLDEMDRQYSHLRVVELTEDAYAVGKSIEMLKLDTFGVRVAAIRRHQQRIVDPSTSTKFEAGDTVVLYGSLQNLINAQECLKQGRGLLFND